MPRTLQHRIAELRALDVQAPAAQAKLRAAIQSSSGALVAAAARLVEDHRLEPLAGELAAADDPAVIEQLRAAAAEQRDPAARRDIAELVG